MTKIHLLATALAASIGAGISAQCFTAAPGMGQGAAIGTEHPVVLGFSFALPDGTMTTDLVIGSVGTINPTGGPLGADFTVTTPELLANTALYPFWADQLFPPVPSTPDILFQTTGTEAVIQFVNYSLSFESDVFNYTVTLDASGSFRFEYDDNFPTNLATPARVGFSDGSGVDPGATDYSTAVGGSFDSGASAIGYEAFFNTPFDIAGSRIDHFPNGMGGYIVIGSDCSLATAVNAGAPCDVGAPPGPGQSITYTPNGMGGMSVTAGSGVSFDSVNPGAPIVTGDESVTTVNLAGWTFPWLGGTPSSLIEIDSNGRIAPPGSYTGGSDPIPTLSEFFGFAGEEPLAGPCLAAFWTDLDPGDPGDDLLFFTDGVSRANITWMNVNQAFETNALTFQIQLDSSGTISVVYEDVSSYDTFGFRDLYLGYSAVSGAFPGESNLIPGGADSGSVPEIYEVFTSLETHDIQVAGNPMLLALTADTLPTIGGIFSMTATNLPTGGLSASVIAAGIGGGGPLPFSVIDADNPCSLATAANILTEFAPAAAMHTFVFDLTTLDLSAAGLLLNWQIISVSDQLPWFLTDTSMDGVFPFATSNGIDGTFGF